jgi:hypothetical protein
VHSTATPSATRHRAKPATPECPQPIPTGSTGSETATSDAPGQLDGLLVDPAATASELTAVLETLSRDGGVLGRQATRLETAIDGESPAPLTSIQALARARWQNIDVDFALSALNTAGTAPCGELFSPTALSSFATELPAPESDGTVELPDVTEGSESNSLSWPTAGCSTASSFLGYAAPETAVYSCDDGAVAVDLTSGATHLLTGLLPQSGGSSNGQSLVLAGDHLAWVTVALTPANGLAKASWSTTLHVIDIGGAPVATRVLQANQHQVDDTGAPYDPSTIVDAGNGWLLISNISSTNSYTYSLTNAVGEVLGSATYPDGDDKAEPVGVIDVGQDPSDYVDEATGKAQPYGGASGYIGAELVNDGGCGVNMLAGSEAGITDIRNPPPNTVELFTRSSSGLAISKVNQITMFSGGDLLANNVAALTPDGVLLASAIQGQWTFYSFAGTKLWTLGNPVVSVANIAGHIVALNTSGQQVIVDAATGKQASLPAQVTQVLDSLAPTSDESATPAQIAFTDPTTDSMLIATTNNSGTSIQNVSYSAICDTQP